MHIHMYLGLERYTRSPGKHIGESNSLHIYLSISKIFVKKILQLKTKFCIYCRIFINFY